MLYCVTIESLDWTQVEASSEEEALAQVAKNYPPNAPVRLSIAPIIDIKEGDNSNEN
jgi:hypothetical protein